MDAHEFYRLLFAPLEKVYGPPDADTIVALIGFDAGGPLNFCTFNTSRGDVPTTYVSCELAVRPEQCKSELGRYELLATCDTESWVRSVLTDIGRMSLDVAFGHGHTLDIGAWVDPDDAIQGIILERACSVEIGGESFGVLRCIGVTRAELDYARHRGVDKVLARLRGAGIYPATVVDRASLLL